MYSCMHVPKEDPHYIYQMQYTARCKIESAQTPPVVDGYIPGVTICTLVFAKYMLNPANIMFNMLHTHSTEFFVYEHLTMQDSLRVNILLKLFSFDRTVHNSTNVLCIELQRWDFRFYKLNTQFYILTLVYDNTWLLSVQTYIYIVRIICNMI